MLAYFKLLRQWKNSSSRNIVMFSEGNIYKLTNLPILRELSQHIHVHYITIDPNDELIKNSPNNVTTFLIKLDFWGLFFLQTLNSKLFITTTPGLGALALKRSPNVVHYSNYLHSPIDLHHYQKYSFDGYNSVICSSEFQVQTLRSLENKRDTRLKETPILGLAYYDYFVEEFKNSAIQTEEKTILLAPSWGNKNILNHYENDLIEELLNAGYKVIFRPHPQSFKAENTLMQFLIQKHQTNPRFSLDTNVSFTESFKKSSMLISSYSGIVFDYVFLGAKPCLIFDLPYVYKNMDSEDIDHECWEYQNIPKYGKLISLPLSQPITDFIYQIEMSPNYSEASIRAVQDEIKNFGQTAPYIAQYYIDKLNSTSN